MYDVIAENGTITAIQAAINKILLNDPNGNGNVFVPSGMFEFNLFDSILQPPTNPTLLGIKIPGGINLLGAGDTTLSTGIESWHSGGDGTSDCLIQLDGSNGKRIRFSGIKLKGSVNFNSTKITDPNYGPQSDDGGNLIGINEYGVTDFRIDHSQFEDFSNTSIVCSSRYIDWSKQSTPIGNQGVIDHCLIDNPYKDVFFTTTGKYPFWAYGIIIGGSGWVQQAWRPISALFGQYGHDHIYIEDSTFQRCRHCVAEGGQGSEGFATIRHSIFTDNVLEHYASFLDVHPGGRGYVVHDNTLIDVPADYRSLPPENWGRYYNRGVYPCGGSGLIYNNRLVNCNLGVGLTNEGFGPYPTNIYGIHDFWVWNNASENVANPFMADTDAVENVDYHLRAPSLGLDGFDYFEYPYPHPLTLDTQGIISVNSTIPNVRFTLR